MLISITTLTYSKLNKRQKFGLNGFLPRFLLLVSLCVLAAVPTISAEIEGRYEKIGTVPKKHTLAEVQFDEYLNFTCPHCNNFRKAAIAIKKKYGKRLKITYFPILFSRQSDYPLRLFYIGQSVGRTEEIKNLIFDAAFESGVNIYDPAIVSYIARSAGLAEKYKNEGNADWVTKKVDQAQSRASAVGIRATPTVVLQESLLVVPKSGMQAFVGNLDHMIEQMLVK